jgi:hypothetical protein
MYVVINGSKNYLPFGLSGAPGYGCAPGQLFPVAGQVYSTQAAATAQLGAGNVLPLVFLTPGNLALASQISTCWAWAEPCYVVYFSHNGTIMGLFTTQLAAQKYATALGTGYTTASCSLSAT